MAVKHIETTDEFVVFEVEAEGAPPHRVSVSLDAIADGAIDIEEEIARAETEALKRAKRVKAAKAVMEKFDGSV